MRFIDWMASRPHANKVNEERQRQQSAFTETSTRKVGPSTRSEYSAPGRGFWRDEYSAVIHSPLDSALPGTDGYRVGLFNKEGDSPVRSVSQPRPGRKYKTKERAVQGADMLRKADIRKRNEVTKAQFQGQPMPKGRPKSTGKYKAERRPMLPPSSSDEDAAEAAFRGDWGV